MANLKIAEEFLSSEMSKEELWKYAIQWQKAALKAQTERDSCIVEVEDAKRVALVFIGDIHIGGIGTDHESFLKVVEFIASTDNVFVVLMGDYYENYNARSPGSGRHEAIFPLEMQKELGVAALKKLNGKVIAVVQGCHDDWSFDTDAYSISAWIAHKTGGVNLGHGGNILMRMGSQEYKIHARHKYNRNSRNDVTFAVRAMYQDLEHFDIGALAHKHTPKIAEEFMIGDEGKRKVVCVSGGTFKLGDRFGNKLGYKSTGGMPTIILSSEEKSMVPFFDISVPVKLGLIK